MIAELDNILCFVNVIVVFVTLLSLSIIILPFKMNINVCQAIIMGLVTLWVLVYYQKIICIFIWIDIDLTNYQMCFEDIFYKTKQDSC